MDGETDTQPAGAPREATPDRVTRDVLSAYTAGLSDGHRLGARDAEVKISNARSDGFAAGRTWGTDQTRHSPALVVVALIFAWCVGYYMLGPYVGALLDRDTKGDRP